MVDNLIRRERNRAAKGTPGLMRGDEQTLLGLQDVVRAPALSFTSRSSSRDSQSSRRYHGT